MIKKYVSIFLILVALLLNFQNVLAHTPVTDGTYTIEVGWTDEPPVVGQRNAVVINVSDSANLVGHSVRVGEHESALEVQILSR